MAHHEIETEWMGEMQFNSLSAGHTIIMDAKKKTVIDEKGIIPTTLILTAVSGCTGMDIVSMLRKEQMEVDNLLIKVTGELSNHNPITYTAIHIVYDFTGNPGCRESAMYAVSASQEHFSGVSCLLKKAIPVTWEVAFNGDQIFNNRMMAETAIH